MSKPQTIEKLQSPSSPNSEDARTRKRRNGLRILLPSPQRPAHVLSPDLFPWREFPLLVFVAGVPHWLFSSHFLPLLVFVGVSSFVIVAGVSCIRSRGGNFPHLFRGGNFPYLFSWQECLVIAFVAWNSYTSFRGGKFPYLISWRDLFLFVFVASSPCLFSWCECPLHSSREFPLTCRAIFLNRGRFSGFSVDVWFVFANVFFCCLSMHVIRFHESLFFVGGSWGTQTSRSFGTQKTILKCMLLMNHRFVQSKNAGSVIGV